MISWNCNKLNDFHLVHGKMFHIHSQNPPLLALVLLLFGAENIVVQPSQAPALYERKTKEAIALRPALERRVSSQRDLSSLVAEIYVERAMLVS